jgi:hypothetical protein
MSMFEFSDITGLHGVLAQVRLQKQKPLQLRKLQRVNWLRGQDLNL